MFMPSKWQDPDKLKFRISEFPQEEASALLPNGEYAIWSPHDATEAAATMTHLLIEQTKSP
jgi:hypothetical protein